MGPQGIYSLVSRGKTIQSQIDSVTNNLANVDTVGYKQDQPTFKSVFARTIGQASQSDSESFAASPFLGPNSGGGVPFVVTADSGQDFSPGRLQRTGNDLDLALSSPQGFFVVNTPNGERYTRAGNFRLGADGQLVNTQGYAVSGKDGAIVLKGDKVVVSQDGTVAVDGRPAGGLRIVTFPFPERLQKLGSQLFAPADAGNIPRIMEDVQLAQGFVESSNVEPVKELTKLIEANRAYSAMQKAISSADEINQKAITLAQV